MIAKPPHHSDKVLLEHHPLAALHALQPKLWRWTCWFCGLISPLRLLTSQPLVNHMHLALKQQLMKPMAATPGGCNGPLDLPVLAQCAPHSGSRSAAHKRDDWEPPVPTSVT